MYVCMMKFKSLSSPVADNLSQQIHLKKAGVGNCNLFYPHEESHEGQRATVLQFKTLSKVLRI